MLEKFKALPIGSKIMAVLGVLFLFGIIIYLLKPKPNKASTPIAPVVPTDKPTGNIDTMQKALDFIDSYYELNPNAGAVIQTERAMGLKASDRIRARMESMIAINANTADPLTQENWNAKKGDFYNNAVKNGQGHMTFWGQMAMIALWYETHDAPDGGTITPKK